MDPVLDYKFIKPGKELSDFVDSFWLLHNRSDGDKEVVILPDGRIDLFFSQSATEPFHVTLLGIGTQPERATIPAGTLIFAISFKLPAAEYILHRSIAGLLNKAEQLPVDFWGFHADDLGDFDLFCEKASHKIQSLQPKETDNRKHKLFELIYSANGALPVKDLSETAFWSSRQINRFFRHQYGVSLKEYCNILRFRASFQHIKSGKLFPEQNFADQSHFIKQIKKLSGVLPKQLNRNQNGRFIQFSTLSPE